MELQQVSYWQTSKTLKAEMECCHFFPRSYSVLDSSVGSANKLQQKEEDLNDVDVDGQSSEHVLLLTDGMFSVSN